MATINDKENVFHIQDLDFDLVVWDDGSFGLWFPCGGGRVTDFNEEHNDARLKVLSRYSPGTNRRDAYFYTKSECVLVVHTDGSASLEVGDSVFVVFGAHLKVVINTSNGVEPEPADCACAPAELKVKVTADADDAVFGLDLVTDAVYRLNDACRDLLDTLVAIRDLPVREGELG